MTNVAMGTTVSIATNDSGLYRAPYLIPGTYQVAVEAAGFKKYLRDGVNGQNQRYDRNQCDAGARGSAGDHHGDVGRSLA